MQITINTNDPEIQKAISAAVEGAASRAMAEQFDRKCAEIIDTKIQRLTATTMEEQCRKAASDAVVIWAGVSKAESLKYSDRLYNVVKDVVVDAAQGIVTGTFPAHKIANCRNTVANDICRFLKTPAGEKTLPGGADVSEIASMLSEYLVARSREEAEAITGGKDVLTDRDTHKNVLQ